MAVAIETLAVVTGDPIHVDGSADAPTPSVHHRLLGLPGGPQPLSEGHLLQGDNVRAGVRDESSEVGELCGVPGARLVIIEMVVGVESSTTTTLMDMTMLYDQWAGVGA